MWPLVFLIVYIPSGKRRARPLNTLSKYCCYLGGGEKAIKKTKKNLLLHGTEAQSKRKWRLGPGANEGKRCWRSDG